MTDQTITRVHKCLVRWRFDPSGEYRHDLYGAVYHDGDRYRWRPIAQWQDAPAIVGDSAKDVMRRAERAVLEDMP